jgi:hypothetical protein
VKVWIVMGYEYPGDYVVDNKCYTSHERAVAAMNSAKSLNKYRRFWITFMYLED